MNRLVLISTRLKATRKSIQKVRINLIKEAIAALQLAVTILTEKGIACLTKGRFSTAANNQKQIAEIYEQDIGDLKQSMEAYEQAAEWYAGEDSNA